MSQIHVYTLSLHDALPIWSRVVLASVLARWRALAVAGPILEGLVIEALVVPAGLLDHTSGGADVVTSAAGAAAHRLLGGALHLRRLLAGGVGSSEERRGGRGVGG